jgi:predicted DNA-binding protein
LEASINARLPAELVERLDALRPALAQHHTIRMSGGRASRSTALRMALEKGLPLLEAELADPPKPKPRTRREKAP